MKSFCMKKLSVSFVVGLLFLFLAKIASATPITTSPTYPSSSLFNQSFSVTVNSKTNSYTIQNYGTTGLTEVPVYFGYVSTNFTGYYIGTAVADSGGANSSGSGSDQLLTEIISYYLGTPVSITDISTSSSSQTQVTNAAGTVLDVTYTSGSSGTWSVENSLPPVSVDFYAVKGSNQFALYYVDPAQVSGNWSTMNLENNGGQQPTISHLTAVTDPTPVPEPATFLFLATGLIGLAGVKNVKRHLRYIRYRRDGACLPASMAV